MSNLLARLAKLEAAAAKNRSVREVTNCELFHAMLHEFHKAAADQEATGRGEPGALTKGGYLRPGAIQVLAERGHKIARIALKLRPFIEQQCELGDHLTRCHAEGLLRGMQDTKPMTPPAQSVAATAPEKPAAPPAKAESAAQERQAPYRFDDRSDDERLRGLAPCFEHDPMGFRK